MKRAHYTYGIDRSGKTYWRSLGELSESKEFQEALQREFPEGASVLADGVSRRAFLQIMGASVGLAGLAACRRPEEKILPYSRAPEQVIPGRPQFYATAMPLFGTAIGLLVESHEGRPTKIEGNPLHPESLGATNTYAQASILDLYDPDRSAGPAEKGQPRSWDEVAAFLQARGEALSSNRGRGLAVLTEEHRSPTLQAALARLKKRMPEARIVRYEPFSDHASREGARIAYGRPLETVHKLGEAQVILALDSDFLGTEGSPVKDARAFAERRRVEKPGDAMNRLYAVESRFTVTGANADHRLRLRASEMPAYLAALAHALATKHGIDLGPELAAIAAKADAKKYENPRRWVTAVARDLASHRGASVILVGPSQPAAVHAFAHLLNDRLGNTGNTVLHVRAFDESPEGPAALVDLAKAMRAGEIDTLVVLGGNPVFAAPADADFAAAMAKVPHTAHLATHADETSAAAAWHLNRAHYLESWGDVRAADGTAAVIQPLIAPLFGGRTDAEVVHLLLGDPRKAHDLVQETWRAERPVDFEIAWRRALHDGVWAHTAFAPESVKAKTEAVAEAMMAVAPEVSGLEVTFHPDPHSWDGRFANNGWLQELADPMNKLTWDNGALLAPATAVGLGVAEGELVDIAVNGRTARLPVVVSPGQAENSIAVLVGQGRRVTGRVGKGVGFDAYGLRASHAMGAAWNAKVTTTGEVHALARTQEHSVMEGRPLVREAALARFHEEPDFARKMVEADKPESIFPDHAYKGHRWGMVIDLNTCTGCSACTVACQAENNIPLVGKDGVMRSREMHWIRVDRYYEGARVDEPNAVFQPIACHHCENAPCEQVCPVGATTHSPEGLNDMAYNRCVGTRYCANNCPYKVRRFNFFNYTGDTPELRKMQHNPDVTVRARGVMEKCTYCVQRIEQVKIAAMREGRDRVRDGEIVTACQQSCPTGAITFGDLNDSNSAVARLVEQPRSYKLLEELNIRPRTSFLAKVRNPNPEMEPA